MWLTVLQVLLVVWLATVLAVMVLTGIRRSWRNPSDPNWSRRNGAQPGFEARPGGFIGATGYPKVVQTICFGSTRFVIRAEYAGSIPVIGCTLSLAAPSLIRSVRSAP
jgi:hypothetical protein